MIGNPLSFNDWNSQYQILDVDIQNLIRIDSIILYKQGFIEADIYLPKLNIVIEY